MKIYLAMILSVMSLSQPSARANGLDDLITFGTTVIGGVAGYSACGHQRDFVRLLCTGGGAGVGFLLGKAITSDRDVRRYNNGFNNCMNAYACEPMRMPDSGYNVQMYPGERVYMYGQPNTRCRSYNEVVTDRFGRVMDQQTRYVCHDGHRWNPAPRNAQIRFYNGPQYDARFRSWQYDAPVVTQPAPIQQPAPVTAPIFCPSVPRNYITLPNGQVQMCTPGMPVGAPPTFRPPQRPNAPEIAPYNPPTGMRF